MKKIVMLLLLASAFAWTGTTHEILAGEVCDMMGCSNRGIMQLGSTDPDRVFHDTVNHHYYDLSWNCPEDPNWECPTENDFIAIELAEDWLHHAKMNHSTALSSSSLGNEPQTKMYLMQRDYAIGVASHYFFDSKVFWHKVQGEKSSMHSYWEQKTENEFSDDFLVDNYGIVVTDEDFDEWRAEFVAALKVKSIIPRDMCMQDLDCADECSNKRCIITRDTSFSGTSVGLFEQLLDGIIGILAAVGNWAQQFIP